MNQKNKRRRAAGRRRGGGRRAEEREREGKRAGEERGMGDGGWGMGGWGDGGMGTSGRLSCVREKVERRVHTPCELQFPLLVVSVASIILILKYTYTCNSIFHITLTHKIFNFLIIIYYSVIINLLSIRLSQSSSGLFTIFPFFLASFSKWVFSHCSSC